ncbi:MULTISPECIES: hypothetical protein [unclassified Agrococcus]|uniref:hypothetical protein n=1 Tax=unclassified Agrococcus TaxID=2615065 RepID=UPI003613089E
MTDELVFKVQGTSALPARETSLAAAGLHERSHLQEWVLANPEILGPDVLVVTSEFDRWMSKDGREADRLDILGLGSDGRLVVAELKRDRAPDYVTTQAINYAARASRFSLEDLADAYLSFVSKGEDAPTTAVEALAALTTHAPELSVETLRNPRITLVAGEFPAAVTSAAVWLTEQGIDMMLIQVRAYEWEASHAVTVSRLWPVADVEDYVVAPARREKTGAKATEPLPATPWSVRDLEQLAALDIRETVLTTLDMCAEKPDEWIGGLRVMAATGRAQAQHRGDYGGFAIVVRRKFDRSNPPFDTWYGEVDAEPPQSYYRLDDASAAVWRRLRGLNPATANSGAEDTADEA